MIKILNTSFLQFCFSKIKLIFDSNNARYKKNKTKLIFLFKTSLKPLFNQNLEKFAAFVNKI